MQIFLSWSGERSKYIANAFRDWLPNVIQAVEPFISTQDIEKGVRGEYVISQKLEQCNIGIVVLTPENQQSPWILFESGALSKVATAHLCTFLYDLSYSEVKPPLASFQHATFKLRDKPELHKTELLEMVKTINSKMVAERRLTASRLETAFETWYPQFEKSMGDLPELKEALPPERKESDKLDEALELLRTLAQGRNTLPPNHDSDRFVGKGGMHRFMKELILQMNGTCYAEQVPGHLLGGAIERRFLKWIDLDGKPAVVATDEGYEFANIAPLK